MSEAFEDEMKGENVIEDEMSVEEDKYGGVILTVQKPMDSALFASKLHDSIAHWNKQRKKGIWINLPILHSNLVHSAVKAGFKYHHAEPDYLMLVYQIPGTSVSFPANASHRVGVGAFVFNDKMEVLVVQETSGKFGGTGVWKIPTGVVDEGEDICKAAIREVKEETEIETKFVEVLAFRQSHKSFFQKSDLFFVCMLQPQSSEIQSQASEIEAAKWMPVKDYAAQPFVQENELFDFIAKICIKKLDGSYTDGLFYNNMPHSHHQIIPQTKMLTRDIRKAMEEVIPIASHHGYSSPTTDAHWSAPAAGLTKVNCLQQTLTRDIREVMQPAEAELWAIYWGLKSAKDHGCSSVILETDSQVASQLAGGKLSPYLPMFCAGV